MLEEVTQVNNQVLGYKSLAQLFWEDVKFTTPSGVVQSLLFVAGYNLGDFWRGIIVVHSDFAIFTKGCH